MKTKWILVEKVPSAERKDLVGAAKKENTVTEWDLLEFEEMYTTCAKCGLSWDNKKGCVGNFGPSGSPVPELAKKYGLGPLLSGEVDFVLDPPPQDIPRLKQDKKIKVVEGNENRTIFFGFDQWRDELQYASLKGRNPFKDVRVGQAFQLAIDVNALKSQVMRGLSTPTAVMFPSQVDGYDKALDVVVKPDRARAKKLLAEAGYPQGFEVTLDCPNNPYINDEKLCQATAAMLAQVNVKVRLNAMPRATYLAR